MSIEIFGVKAMPKGIPKDGRKPWNPNIAEIGKRTRFQKESKLAAENGKKAFPSKKEIRSFAEEIDRWEKLTGEKAVLLSKG